MSWKYLADNPLADETGSITTTYQLIRIQRAPSLDPDATPLVVDPAGWADVGDPIDIDPSNEVTPYLDPDGNSTSWYRHRFESTDTLSISDWSTPILVGDYVVRQRLLAEMPPIGDEKVDLTNALLDQWRDEVIEQLRLESVWRPAVPQEFTPSSGTDYEVALRADIRVVRRVEMFTDSGGFIRELEEEEWRQRGRTLIIRPLWNATYSIEGLGDIRSLADMDNELFPLLKAAMEVKYYLWQTKQRANFRVRQSESQRGPSLEEIRRMAADAQARYERLLAAAHNTEGL